MLALCQEYQYGVGEGGTEGEGGGRELGRLVDGWEGEI